MENSGKILGESDLHEKFCIKRFSRRTSFFIMQVLKGAKTLEGRPGAELPPYDFAKSKAELEEKHGVSMTEQDVMSAALYPKVFDDFVEFRETYGPVDQLDTKTFLIGPEIAEETTVRNAI